jgi:hypothetical protein
MGAAEVVNSAILAALIGLIGSVIAVALTYWTTKRREREAEWRKEKLSYYKAFIESLSGIVQGDATPEGHRLYARATNNLLLFAPQAVVEALNAFRDETRISNPSRSIAKHNKMLATLLLAIRHDVGVVPPDNAVTFNPVLWASGTSEDPEAER